MFSIICTWLVVGFGIIYRSVVCGKRKKEKEKKGLSSGI